MKNSKWITDILIHLGFVLAAAVLFAASFPNPVFVHGLPYLAWFAFIPILIVINKYGLAANVCWGGIYGLTAYSLLNYWLSSFHPIAGTIVYTIYFFYLALVFAFLKLAYILFPKKGYLVQWVIWLAYEYLRTLGFLGYSYGIIGYSQWQMIPLIQIASITGVWGVSALVAFPSFWLAAAMNTKNNNYHEGDSNQWFAGAQRKKVKFQTKKLCATVNLWFKCDFVVEIYNVVKMFLVKEKIPAIIWAAALIAALSFGIVSNRIYSNNIAVGTYPTAQITLIQHNTDPWKATQAPTPWQVIDAHRKDLATLTRLSDEALGSDPKPQLVVWPETSFIPRIYWHTTYRENQNVWLIVKELLDYLSVQDVPFLIGNDDARMEPAKNPDSEKRHRVDYNAAMLFEKGQNTETYRKLHLVPFTEHFPYKKLFPKVNEWLNNSDTHFWEKGNEETVFILPEFSFSAPICFEDTFGYLSRNFVSRGADVLINMSNDAWSNSKPAQYQHLTTAVFRAVENNRSMVRSTSTGQTCAINPMGRITSMAPAFEETWLNVTVPIVKSKTIYTIYGDYFGILSILTAILLLIFGAVWYTIKKRRGGQVL